MFLGRVAGTVWSTVKWPQAQGLKLLLVRPYRLGDLPPGVAAGAGGSGGTASEPTDDLVVCADILDAGTGDDVIVAFGHAARVALSEKLPPGSKPSVPIDAAVVAVVDRVEIPAVKDVDLRRIVAEVTREVTARAERGGKPAPAAGDARRGGRAVVTTTGKNQRGIVARIAQAIADAGGDIVDISQTLLSDYFTMIIIVDTGALSVSFAEFKTRLERTVAALGAECLVMHEDVVNALQRV